MKAGEPGGLAEVGALAGSLEMEPLFGVVDVGQVISRRGDGVLAVVLVDQVLDYCTGFEDGDVGVGIVDCRHAGEKGEVSKEEGEEGKGRRGKGERGKGERGKGEGEKREARDDGEGTRERLSLPAVRVHVGVGLGLDRLAVEVNGLVGQSEFLENNHHLTSFIS